MDDLYKTKECYQCGRHSWQMSQGFHCPFCGYVRWRFERAFRVFVSAISIASILMLALFFSRTDIIL